MAAAAAVGAVAVADGGRRRNWRESLPSNRSPRRGYNGPSAEEERGKLEGVGRSQRPVFDQSFHTMKPRFSAPAFTIIPPIEHTNFGL